MKGTRLAVLAILACGAASSQDTTAPRPSVPGRETLEYGVEWRLIPAGTAKLSWAGLSGGANSGELRLHLESAGLVSRLFRVNDDYTAALSQNLCAQNTFLSAHEGSRSKETRVVFDGQNHRASYVEKDLIKNSTINQDVEIPSCVHDVL